MRCTSSGNAPDVTSATAMAPPPRFSGAPQPVFPARHRQRIVAASSCISRKDDVVFLIQMFANGCRADRGKSDRALERDREKWILVFRKDHAPLKIWSVIR